MSRTRLALFALLCLPVLLWSFSVLRMQYLRMQYRPLIFALETRATLPDQPTLRHALADYQRVSARYPCNAGMQQDLLLLLAQDADAAMQAEDLEQGDAALQALQAGLRNALTCNPMDGKLWLNLASVITHAEGLSAAARDAYVQSARVAPKEAWLAEKRLLFIVPFAPLLDARLRAVARADSAVLSHAAGFRKTKVMKAAQVASAEALDALFAAP